MQLSLPVCLAAYAVGILLSSYLIPQPFSAAMGFAVIAAILVGVFFRAARPLVILLLLLGAGIQLSHWQETVPADLAPWSDRTLHWQGTVVSIIRKPTERWQADLTSVQLCREQQCVTAPGRLRIYGRGEMPTARPGDGLGSKGKVRTPRNFHTPGEFNYRRHLVSHQIYLTSYVRDPQQLEIVRRETTSLIDAVFRWRASLARMIEHHLPLQQVGLVQALAIGESAMLLPEQRQALGRCGLAHLFAISGLHVGLLGWLLYQILAFGYRRSLLLLNWQPAARALPPLLILPLSFYLLMAGAGIATQRALLVAAVVAVLGLFARSVAPWRILVAVAFALLLADPLQWFSAGFQLSFAGAGAIVLSWPRWRRLNPLMPKPLQPIYGLFAVSLAATLATVPLVGHHFHQLSWIGPLMNLWAVPLVGFIVVPTVLLAAAISSFSPDAAVALWRLCGAGLEFTVTCCQKLLQWMPAAGQNWFEPEAVYALVGLAALCLLLPWRPMGRWCAVASLVLSCYLLIPLTSSNASLHLFALSVGQGDATLIGLGQDRYWLIDGGGLYSETFDVGERLLLPALSSLGVTRLEGVVLTHRHPDHWKGLVGVMRQLPVDNWVAGHAWDQQPPPLAAVLADASSREVHPLPGWNWLYRSPDGDLAVWWSPDQRRENDRSLVVYARQGTDGVLLTGDLQAEGVDALLADGLPGPISLLKLPHHGSRYSHSEALVQAVKPQRVYVSSGDGNRYRLPASSLVDWLADQQIPLDRTDQQGTVELRCETRGWRSRSWNRGLFR